MASEDADRLFTFCRDMAEHLLRKNGAFYPIGATIDASGELNPIAVFDGDEQPPSQQVIDQLFEVLGPLAQDNKIRAGAVAYDSLLPDDTGRPSDAITVLIETAAGESIQVWQHYRKAFLKGFVFGEVNGARVPGRMHFPVG